MCTPPQPIMSHEVLSMHVARFGLIWKWTCLFYFLICLSIRFKTRFTLSIPSLFELFVTDWKLNRIISISFLFDYICSGGGGPSASGRSLSFQLATNIDIAQANKCNLMYANIISLGNKLEISQLIKYFYELMKTIWISD